MAPRITSNLGHVCFCVSRNEKKKIWYIGYRHIYQIVYQERKIIVAYLVKQILNNNHSPF